MKNVIILHAMEDSPNDHWYPWLKSQLEQKGYKVWVPQLPNTNNPQLTNWVPFIMSKGEFTSETVIIGHSAGASVILAILEELKDEATPATLRSGFQLLKR